MSCHVPVSSFGLRLELLLAPLGVSWCSFWLPLEGLALLWVALVSSEPPPWVFPWKSIKIGGSLPENMREVSRLCTKSSLLEFLSGIRSHPRISRFWVHDCASEPPCPHALGARMTVVDVTNSLIFCFVVVPVCFFNHNGGETYMVIPYNSTKFRTIE